MGDNTSEHRINHNPRRGLQLRRHDYRRDANQTTCGPGGAALLRADEVEPQLADRFREPLSRGVAGQGPFATPVHCVQTSSPRSIELSDLAAAASPRRFQRRLHVLTQAPGPGRSSAARERVPRVVPEQRERLPLLEQRRQRALQLRGWDAGADHLCKPGTIADIGERNVSHLRGSRACTGGEA